MGPMARSSSEDFDQWAFAIDQRRTRSPWQNGYAERLIGSIRRECVDHIIVLGERHLRHVLLSYMQYYNEVRTHLSLKQGCTGIARRRSRRAHSLSPNPGRTSSS